MGNTYTEKFYKNPESELCISLYFWYLLAEPKHRHLSKSTCFNSCQTIILNHSLWLYMYVLTIYVCRRSIYRDCETWDVLEKVIKVYFILDKTGKYDHIISFL